MLFVSDMGMSILCGVACAPMVIPLVWCSYYRYFMLRKLRFKVVWLRTQSASTSSRVELVTKLTLTQKFASTTGFSVWYPELRSLLRWLIYLLSRYIYASWGLCCAKGKLTVLLQACGGGWGRCGREQFWCSRGVHRQKWKVSPSICS